MRRLCFISVDKNFTNAAFSSPHPPEDHPRSDAKDQQVLLMLHLVHTEEFTKSRHGGSWSTTHYWPTDPKWGPLDATIVSLSPCFKTFLIKLYMLQWATQDSLLVILAGSSALRQLKNWQQEDGSAKFRRVFLSQMLWWVCVPATRWRRKAQFGFCLFKNGIAWCNRFNRLCSCSFFMAWSGARRPWKICGGWFSHTPVVRLRKYMPFSNKSRTEENLEHLSIKISI